MYLCTVPDHALNNAVAAELNDLRLKERRTYEEIAAAAGISLISAKRYLAGSRGIPIDVLGALALYLGDDPVAVFTRATARVQRND